MAANGKDKPTRIAVVSEDRCKPKRCQQECRKSCPVVRMGRMCIEVTPTDKVAYLSEDLCIGCGICTKKCPFDAISIINIPSNLGKDTTHRYGPNSFKLHRLPSPRSASVLGLVGANGTGKTTALKILSGKLKPNLGRFEDAPDWKDIITDFRGSQLQNYFTHMLEDELKAVMKPQYVDVIPRAVQGTIGELLRRKDTLGTMAEVCEGLCLTELMDKPVVKLSGGELQRFAIAMVCVQQADIYIFDEPSSYLDVKQRLHAAKVIRNMATDGKYVIVVEHDLAVLDYLSDYVCCLYGKPGAYGVVTLPSKVREGINIFMDGYIPTENMRFRESGLVFNISQKAEERDDKRFCHYDYPEMTITLDSFHLTIHEGAFSDSEIIVMLGENGTGKTTFIRMLAGKLQADGGETVPKLNVSYKPQKVSPKYPGTVRQLFHSKIQASYIHPQFISDVIKPMSVETLLDQKVENLSGGELQRVALTLCLGKPADVYLIDEPSAYLDSEQRLHAAKVIKRFILHAKKTAFIVEHDFIMATYLADRVVVFEGEPSIRTVANTPQTMLAGVNQFLRSLDITFRRDPHNLRPRINKLNGVRDIEQKKSGQYFFIED